MAKKMTYNVNKTTKFAVSGLYNHATHTVTYEDKDEGVVDVDIRPYLEQFNDCEVSLSITKKEDKELDLPDADEDEEE